MAVFKDRTKWRAALYWEGEKIKTKNGFDSRTAAQEWHDKELAKVKEKAARRKTAKKKPEPVKKEEVKATPLTLEDVIARFREVHLPTIRTGTQVRYELDLKSRIIPFFQGCELTAITQMMVEDFKIQMLVYLSPKSVNNCLEVLKLLLRKAMEWGLIKENPAQYVPLQKIAEQKYNWWQEKKHIAKFLAAAKKDPYYLAYRLALDCGLRLGEIIGLSKQDVNLSLCQIHIHRQWLEKEGKYGPTKQGRERYVGFEKDSELYQLFEKALEKHPENEIIFFTSTGNRLSGRKLSGYYFSKLIKESGVPKIRFHDLRHTFASWFMITTDNIWDLKYLMGHADIQITQRYAHLSAKKRITPNFGWET